jgi:hypothetical protein
MQFVPRPDRNRFETATTLVRARFRAYRRMGRRVPADPEEISMSIPFESNGPWSYFGEPVVGGPVTCATCGCRLTADQQTESWYHFAGSDGRDARGCRVACATDAHDHRGRPREAIAA